MIRKLYFVSSFDVVNFLKRTFIGKEIVVINVWILIIFVYRKTNKICYHLFDIRLWTRSNRFVQNDVNLHSLMIVNEINNEKLLIKKIYFNKIFYKRTCMS